MPFGCSVRRISHAAASVVSPSGVTSKKAIDALRKSGFENSFNLNGGMLAWNQAGLPVVSGKKTKARG